MTRPLDPPLEPAPSTKRSMVVAASSGVLSLLGGAGGLLVSAVAAVAALIAAWFAYVCWVSEFASDPFSALLELVVLVLGIASAIVSVTAGVVGVVALAVAIVSPVLFMVTTWRNLNG